MRDYTRKAKRVDNGEWIIGYLVSCDERYFIAEVPECDTCKYMYEGYWFGTFYEVAPDTICNPTGLTDKNGNKIWENDVVEIHIFHEIAEGHGTHVNEKGVICYDKIGMLSVAVDITDGIPCYSDILFQAEIAGIGFDIEVIGNIFDNADLLKGE